MWSIGQAGHGKIPAADEERTPVRAGAIGNREQIGLASCGYEASTSGVAGVDQGTCIASHWIAAHGEFEKIAQAVGFAFETTVRKDSDRITAAEFAAANKKNDDLFDWRGLADDLADYVDDMSRMA